MASQKDNNQNTISNEYEPPGFVEQTFKGIDNMYNLTEQYPVQWSIAKSCVFFGLGLVTLERLKSVVESL